MAKMRIFIKLTEEDLSYCEKTGKARNKFAINNNYVPVNNQKRSETELNHILGVQGELAVCKYFEVKHKPAIGYIGHHDVGKIGVRTGKSEGYRLILHQSDEDTQPFVLVVKSSIEGDFYICGWIMGKEGKNEKYWEDPFGGRPAYFIPQVDLREDLDILRDYLI
jgi:hypothetical protein